MKARKSDQSFECLFKNVSSSKQNFQQEEYPDKLINELTDQFEIFGSIAECASSFEHNLLASAFFEVFSYTEIE